MPKHIIFWVKSQDVRAQNLTHIHPAARFIRPWALASGVHFQYDQYVLPHQPILTSTETKMLSKAQSYAGLWPRLKAFALDYLILGGYLLLLLWVGVSLIGAIPGFSERVSDNPLLGQLLGFVSVTLPVSLYFALSEASTRQATWGKHRMQLQVSDTAGARLSIPRALLRTALKFIPWELAHACIWQVSAPNAAPSPLIVYGFILVWVLVGANLIAILIGKRHQALYDLLAGTLVIRLAAPSPSTPPLRSCHERLHRTPRAHPALAAAGHPGLRAHRRQAHAAGAHPGLVSKSRSRLRRARSADRPRRRQAGSSRSTPACSSWCACKSPMPPAAPSAST